MTEQWSFLPKQNAYDADSVETAALMAEGLGRTINIARSLVENGRVIDLTGLDLGVGLLCAKALDLPPEAGRAFRGYLVDLIHEADALTAALKQDAGA